MEVPIDLQMKMKNMFYFLAAAVMSFMMMTACDKDNGGLSVDGEWHGSLTVSGSEAADVYISFGDGSFTLWQKTGSQQRYYIYTGTYTLNGDLLSGRYSDGNKWGADYVVSVTGDSLSMTAQNGSNETIIYARGTVPETVKASAVEAPAVKAQSAQAAPSPVL